MDLQHVRDIVEVIAATAAWDDQGAHAQEDALLRDVLWAIAAGAEQPRILAAGALAATFLDFNRWSA